VYLIYSCLLAAVLALYLPVYYLRMKFLKKDRIYLRQRLGRGIQGLPAGKKAVWFHAVSVGEVISLQNLIRELKTRHPDWAVAFSSLTNTGLEIAREKLKDADSIFFIPLDLRGSVRRALRAVDPKLLVLAESEFWPNLLRESRRHGTKILLINGRMSETSYKKYDNIRPLAKKVLGNVDLFLVQTEPDREKLNLLGVGQDRIRVAGNLKSEVHLPRFLPEELTAFRLSLGISGPDKIVVAGSTRKGEEERLLSAFSRVRDKRGDLRLILAPRHIERAGEIEKLSQGLGFRTVLRTRPVPAKGWDVLILDTLGELARFYALSDASFIGGSLVEWGGHNILEPAFYGKPVFFGPHMKNFADLADSFIRGGAARIVRTEADLEEMFLMRDEAMLRELGAKAAAVLASLGGATERTLLAIERFMETER
jgi:3-deoxy-D-manno-octulosonic-acid transferase